MSTPIVYGLSKCDTCRKARKWLDRAGIAHQFVDYREHRIPPEALKAWAAQLGGWDQLVNKAGTTWRALPATRRMPESAPEWSLLLREHPALVRRPVLYRDVQVTVGLSEKLYRGLFPDP